MRTHDEPLARLALGLMALAMDTVCQGAYRSEAAAAVHEMIKGFERAGLVDKQTLREFDARCLTATAPINPEEIKAIQKREP